MPTATPELASVKAIVLSALPSKSVLPVASPEIEIFLAIASLVALPAALVPFSRLVTLVPTLEILDSLVLAFPSTVVTLAASAFPLSPAYAVEDVSPSASDAEIST